MSNMFAILCFFLVLFPFAAGIVCWAVGRGGCVAGDRLAQLSSALVFVGCLTLSQCVGGALSLPGVLGLGLSFQLDGLRLVLCCLAGFLWMMTTLFTPEYLAGKARNNRYYLFLLFTLGSTLGVFLSADLYTTLVFFEIMSLSSWALVAQRETAEAVRAADSYLAFAILGGLSTLMGLFLLYQQLGTLTIRELAAAAAAVSDKRLLYVAGAFTAGGFAAKSCVFLVHTWLPGAYTEAPTPATALLSGIITKAGIFGLFALSGQLFLHDAGWGLAVLLFAVATMAVGALLALFSTELKRTLAYSSMSQIGFILVGAGMQGLLGEENGLAVWGSVLHVTNHSLIKLCLFLVAGVVVMNLHAVSLNEVRGFGRGKPVLMIAFLLGALGIGGVPGFSGYISKTLLHESIVEYIGALEAAGQNAGLFRGIEWIFLASGGLTVAYMTKLFVTLFVQKHPTRQAEFDALNGHYMSKLATVVVAVSALPMLVLGVLPHFTMDKVAALSQGFFSSEGPEHTIAYFSLTNLQGAAISIVIGAVVYILVVRGLVFVQDEYRYRLPRWLDLEKVLYRPLVLGLLPFLGALIARVAGSVMEWLIALCNGVLMWRSTPTITPRSDETFCAYEPHNCRMPSFTSSLSFGLMLFGLGLVFILVYLLFF